MRSMRIVMLLHNDFTSDPRVAREARTLAEAGHQVRIVALRSDGLPDAEQVDGYEVRRVGEYSSAGWSRPWRKLSEMRRRGEALAREATGFQPGVVHCHDLDTLAAGARVARDTRARLVYDAHELFTEMTAFANRPAPVRAYWRREERRLAPMADAVVTVNDERAALMRERLGVESVVVRSVPDLAPMQRTGRLRAEHGISAGNRVVLYQGALIAGRALTTLVRAMQRVPEATLVIQGAGPLEPELREVVVSHDLQERVRLAGWVIPADLHEYACDADVGVVIYENVSLNNFYAAPNKLYAYLMAGLPMVSSDFPGLRSVVVDREVGSVFDPSSETSIASAIRALLADDAARTEMSARARTLAETEYNWEIESHKLLDLYARFAEEPRP